MAKCPSCGVKLKLTDWKQNCPQCDTNLVYFGMEERLQTDADKAETELALFQKSKDRLRASLLGSRLTIVRIALCVLPLGMLFLPLAKLSVAGRTRTGMGLWQFIQLFLDENVDMAVLPPTLLAAIGAAVLFVLMLLLAFIFVMLSCSPKGGIRNIIMDIVLLANAVAIVALLQQSGGTFAFGAYLLLGSVFALLLLNIVIHKQGIAVQYTPMWIDGIPADIYLEAKKNGTDIDGLRQKYQDIQAEAIEA